MDGSSPSHVGTSQNPQITSREGTKVDQWEGSALISSAVPNNQKFPNDPSHSTAKDILNSILNFLSNASNETLGTCLIALAVAIYLILGRVGLVLIGVLVGVVLHSGLEEIGKESKGAGVDAEVKRREAGLSVITRILDLRQPMKQKHRDPVEKSFTTSLSTAERDFCKFPKDIGRALKDLTDAVVRDYVR